ncbi:MAG: hypothetical protein HYY06_26695 [Deltaproteobacteria bacterium]|nr:hypothetical protein [Deltaproteobacteria bacterium]
MSARLASLGLAALLASCGGKAGYVPPTGEDAAAADADAGDDAASADASADAEPPTCTVDEDGDRSTSADCGGRDCDDGDPSIRPGADDPGEWTFETVDAGGWALGPSLALDRAGEVHLVYENLSEGTLSHATKAGDEWVVEAIEAGGRGAALAIDGEGVLHVLHESDDGLRHARLGAEGWASDDAARPAEGHRLAQPSLAIDGDGRLRLAFRDVAAGSSALHLGTWDGDWTIAPLARGGLADPPDDGAPSLAADAEGTVHVVFTSGGELRHVALVGDEPVADAIAPGADASAPRLAFDPSGNAVVAYRNETDRSLWIARSDGETWAVETVDARNDPGQPALAVDRQGAIHLLYHAAGNFDLRYATNAFGDWVFQTVDRSGEAGTAIAIDGDGAIQMGFATTDSDLRFAGHVGGDGIDQDCSGKIDG